MSEKHKKKALKFVEALCESTCPESEAVLGHNGICVYNMPSWPQELTDCIQRQYPSFNIDIKVRNVLASSFFLVF